MICFIKIFIEFTSHVLESTFNSSNEKRKEEEVEDRLLVEFLKRQEEIEDKKVLEFSNRLEEKDGKKNN